MLPDDSLMQQSHPCQTTYYILKNNQFSKVGEDKQGCSVDWYL